MEEIKCGENSQAGECTCSAETGKRGKIQAYYKKHQAKITLWASFFVIMLVSVLSTTLFISIDYSVVSGVIGYQIPEINIGAFTIVIILMPMLFASYTSAIQATTVVIAALICLITSMVFLVFGIVNLFRKKPMLLIAAINIFTNLFAMVLVCMVTSASIVGVSTGTVINGAVLAGFIIGGIIIAALTVLNYMYIYDKSTIKLTLSKAISLIVFAAFEIILLELLMNSNISVIIMSVEAISSMGADAAHLSWVPIFLFVFCIIYLIFMLCSFISISRALIYGKSRSRSFAVFAVINIAINFVIFALAIVFFEFVATSSSGSYLPVNDMLNGVIIDKYITMFVISVIELVVALALRSGFDKPKLNQPDFN